jgi:hypothetical protein
MKAATKSAGIPASAISYLGWNWDARSGISSDVLIIDLTGMPTAGFGAYIKAQYLCRGGGTRIARSRSPSVP